MKNAYKILSLLIVLTLCTCIGCSKATDNELQITNGYYLSGDNATNISIMKDEENVHIKGHVYEYCYNDTYICALQVKATPIIEALDVSNPTYYVIDTTNDEVSKGMNKEEYQQYLSDEFITDLSEWKGTTPLECY